MSSTAPQSPSDSVVSPAEEVASQTPARRWRFGRLLFWIVCIGLVFGDMVALAWLLRPEEPPPLAVAPFGTEQAAQHQDAWARELDVLVVFENTLGMRFALIPPGKFTMGAKPDEFAVKDREQPQHEVTLTKPVYLGVHEVRLDDFRAFVKDTGYQIDPLTDPNSTEKTEVRHGQWVEDLYHPWEKPGFTQDGTHPVVNVTWYDAMAFCRWLSGKEGRTYRLAYEAEWEFACRAGTETTFHSGHSLWYWGPMENHADQSLDPGFVVHLEDASPWDDGHAYTAPVGTFPPNAFGLRDTHGNVREWCQDWCDEDYYHHSPSSDPRGPETGDERILRGGCWGSNEYYCRSGRRMKRDPGDRNTRNGFRIACEIPLASKDAKPSNNAGNDVSAFGGYRPGANGLHPHYPGAYFLRDRPLAQGGPIAEGSAPGEVREEEE